jgi:FkbM family methyltransferase
MLKPFRYLLPERFLFPVKGFFRLHIGKGQFIWLEGHYTSFITRRLFWHGIKGFEYYSVLIFKELIKKSMVFFDIGANLGYYSLIAEKVNPRTTIYAFEPFPDAIKALERNIKKNGFQKIHVVPLALSDKSGENTLYYRVIIDFPETLQLAGNNSMVNFRDDRDKQVKVETQTLDNFVENLNPGSIDLIKIDTETTEYTILSNGVNAINRFRPVILCEVLPGKFEQKLEDLFLELRYRFYRVEKGGVFLVPGLEVVGEEENDFFFVPEEKIDWMEQFIIQN